MNDPLQSAAHWGRQALLTGGAVLGALCILVAILAALFGLRPLVFESGSMSPTIDTGALALSHQVDASSLARGQIVSVPAGHGVRVTHRIVSVTQDGDAAILRLQGDANETADAAAYRVTHADKVLFDVPLVGYAIGWTAGPLGLFLLGLYAAFLLSVLLKRSPEPPGGGGQGEKLSAQARVVPPSRPARRKGRHAMVTSGLALVLVAGAASALVLEQQVTPTLAAWTDGADVSGTSLTGYTVPAPDGSACAPVSPGNNASRGVDLTWPANAAPLPLLSYNSAVSGLQTNTATLTDVSTDKQLEILYDPSKGGNQSKLVTVTATAFPVGTASWLSPTTSWKFRTGNKNNVQPTCGEANAPTVTIVAPDGASRTAVAEQLFVGGASGCMSITVAFCGTMADASTITNVDYIFQRVQSGVTKCWSGSGWVNCNGSYLAATIQSQTVFYETGAVTTVYATPGGAYNLTVRVTDAWANVTTSTVSFTVTA